MKNITLCILFLLFGCGSDLIPAVHIEKVTHEIELCKKHGYGYEISSTMMDVFVYCKKEPK